MRAMMTTQRREAGFTLVELMISLVLFGLLTAGVLSVAVSVGQGFREQRQVAETDTAVRAPMDYIIDVLRQASPGVPSGQIYASDGDPACSQSSVVVGDGSGSGSSDVLDVVYASGGVVTTLMTGYGAGATSITVADPTGISVGDTLVISNEQTGVIVFVIGVSGSNITLAGQSTCANALLAANPFAAGAVAIRALKARFSVGFDVQLTTIPVLFVTPYTSLGLSASNAQPLAENIEDMQLAQGIDTNLDNMITTGASGPPGPNEWQFASGNPGPLIGQTRALRVTLIGRSPQALIAGGLSFQRPQAEDHAASATLDAFRRRVLTSTVELRNTTKSP